MDEKKLAALKAHASQLEGVEIHGTAIRISFYYHGIRCKEPLKSLTLTKNNLKFAFNKRMAIMHEIDCQTFDYASHFPNSKKAALFSTVRKKRTVEEAVNLWLEVKKTKTAPETYRNYHSKAHNHVIPRWDQLYLDQLTKTEIERWMSVDLAKYSNKTINDIMTILRGSIRDACADGLLDSDPTQYIKNLTVVKDDPDPFTRKEISIIQDTETKRISEVNAFVFSCWTGLSLSEMLALAWEDIDFNKWQLKVKRANVNGTYKIPKEVSRERTIDLLEPAIEILKAQKAISYMLAPQSFEVLQRDNKKTTKEPLRIVFVQTKIRKDSPGGAFKNDYYFRDKFFTAHIKKAGVRYRGPNNARHTYACQLLTAGVPKEWIANQMGHTSTKMIDEHYGKWMSEEKPQMAGFVNGLLGVDQSTEETNNKKSEI